MDSSLSREEDGAINAGYAIWRELIAEVIAFEMDDKCFVIPLSEKSALLRYYEEDLETMNVICYKAAMHNRLILNSIFQT